MKSIILSVCGLLACVAGAFPLNPSFTPEAVAAYKAKADAGDAEAQYLYSSALAYGQGVAEDMPQAFVYAKKAADQGYERALRRVGLGYEEGWGIESNAVKAADCFARFVKWATEAAEKGDANAQCNLGWCYARGTGVKKDMTEAVKWYRKAAEKGDADAQCNLGWCYARGGGVKKDVTEAVKWYRKAADQNNAYGWHLLGMCYLLGDGIDENVEEGAKLFRKAAERGYAFAQNSLGWCYAEGKGVPKDMAEAVAWFRKAAEQGAFNAQLNLGWCYAEGEGVEQDVAESNRWYDKASQKAPSDVYRNSRWVILSLELWFMLVVAKSVFLTEYSPSVVLQHMRSKRSSFLQMSPGGYPGLVMGIVAAIALLVMSVYLDDPLRNVARVEFGLVNPLATELLTILRLFALPGFFVLLAYVSIRRFVKWRRMRRSATRPQLAYAQYRICVVAGMSGGLIFVLWLAYVFARMGFPILVGVCTLVMVAVAICTWPTRKKYAKIVNGETVKYAVIYREPGEAQPKETVVESCSESSLRRECEAKGWQVLLIRPANERGRSDRFVRAFTGELHLPIRFGVSTTELCAFCENMGTLYRTGVPLPQIIDDCIQKEGNAWFRKRLLIVRERLQGGDSLAVAMEDPRCVKAFPLSLRRRMRREEANGRLGDSLRRFVLLYKFEKTRREVLQGMISSAIYTVFWLSFLVVLSMIAEPSMVIGNRQLPVYLRISNWIHFHQVCGGFVLLLLIGGIGVVLWVCVKLFSTRIALWKFRRAMRRQKSKKAHFTESRGFVLLIVFLVVVVLPFGLEAIGDATGLFSLPASNWMKEAFAILTR